MDFKLDIELKIKAKPLTPKTGLQERPPFERNVFTITQNASKFVYGINKSDIATMATNALLPITRRWALSSTEPTEVITEPATNITASEFKLNGRVHPHGTSTAVTFQYGTSIALGTEGVAKESPVTGSSWVTVSYTKSSGVSANTQYYFRIKTAAGTLTIYSEILTFKTPPAS